MTNTRSWAWYGIGAVLCMGVAWNALAARRVAAAKNADSQDTARREVAITVDDLPGALPGNDFAYGDLKELQKINHAIPAALKAHHAWAIG
ncbi:MAG: hypothetical protein WA474_20830, partial [Candidatus Sulfotelmatobacter sp.]